MVAQLHPGQVAVIGHLNRQAAVKPDIMVADGPQQPRALCRRGNLSHAGLNLCQFRMKRRKVLPPVRVVARGRRRVHHVAVGYDHRGPQLANESQHGAKGNGRLGARPPVGIREHHNDAIGQRDAIALRVVPLRVFVPAIGPKRDGRDDNAFAL